MCLFHAYVTSSVNICGGDPHGHSGTQDPFILWLYRPIGLQTPLLRTVHLWPVDWEKERVEDCAGSIYGPVLEMGCIISSHFSTGWDSTTWPNLTNCRLVNVVYMILSSKGNGF